jgi:hypothetical protein
MKSSHEIGLGLLNLRILFTLIINNMKLFEFVTNIFLNHMFKNRFIYIHQNSNRCHNLQSRLQVD